MNNLGRGLAGFVERITLRLADGILRHWLALLVLALAIYAFLPFAAPVLMQIGRERLARVVYALFRPLCHQLPERSFFLFGEQLTYRLEELSAHLGDAVPVRYVGDPILGYKVAVCQRDVAIYGAMCLATIAYALMRGRLGVIGARWLLVGAAPMAVDGGGQLLGLWTSTPASRVITGALFGFALMRWALPYLGVALASPARVSEDD